MIVTAKLIKRATDDGFIELQEHVPLGKQYRVDTSETRTAYYIHVTGVPHAKVEVWDVDNEAWLPMEMLDLARG